MTYIKVSNSQRDQLTQATYLQPVTTPLAWLIATLGCVQHLYHETLTRCLNTGLKQFLDFIEHIGVAVLGELEFSFNRLEALMHKLPAFS